MVIVKATVQVYDRTCRRCEKTRPLCDFMNYREPSINARRPPPFYSKFCRSCRTDNHLQKCDCCEKHRKEESFIQNPRPNVLQDEWCLTCRRDIERQWARGRWQIEGYTNMRYNGKQSRVRCDACFIVLLRRHISQHDKTCGGTK